jgi:hypothetical protein
MLSITDGVNVTEQLADAPLPLSVHVVTENVPLLLGLTLQLTAPVGVMWFCPLSVTVTVHVTGVPTVSVLEAQLTVVVVERRTAS